MISENIYMNGNPMKRRKVQDHFGGRIWPDMAGDVAGKEGQPKSIRKKFIFSMLKETCDSLLFVALLG